MQKPISYRLYGFFLLPTSPKLILSSCVCSKFPATQSRLPPSTNLGGHFAIVCVNPHMLKGGWVIYFHGINYSCKRKKQMVLVTSRCHAENSSNLNIPYNILKCTKLGRLGGSAVEYLPLAQDVIPESQDRVSHRNSLHGALFSLCLCLCLSLSLSLSLSVCDYHK